MIIKNFDKLATSERRKKVLEIVDAGIDAVLPQNVMKNSIIFANDIFRVGEESFSVKGKFVVLGAGKASVRMAEEFERIVGSENIRCGVVSSVDMDSELEVIEYIKASHPIPDERGVAASKRMLDLRGEIEEDDLVIALISGGGSALMPFPASDITLEDKQNTVKALLSCGAEIHEINTVRKHISRIKGGQLGAQYAPNKMVCLILSDVIGNDLDTIASGPTAPDKSTFKDAYEILIKYDILDKVPASVVEHINKGVSGEVNDTPEKLDNCYNYIIGDNRIALNAMREKAVEFGWNAVVVTDEQKGEPGIAAKERAEEIIAGEYDDYDIVLLGGETTPKLPENPGKGGRNQHYALVSFDALKGKKKFVVASVGTDGVDFHYDAAGAIVDDETFEDTRPGAIEDENIKKAIEKYDSYPILKENNCIIDTGATGTNVCDVVVYLIE